MPFLTTQEIRDRLNNSMQALVSDADTNSAQCACYELKLGDEAFITSPEGIKKKYNDGEQIRIPPGQFAILLTKEEINLPNNYLAFISIKSSIKLSGLVNVSGFHVDPGFKGRLKFSVYNAGPEAIVLNVGKRVFLIWFYELNIPDENEYKGNSQGQQSISSKDVMRLQGEVVSPATLKKEVEELRATVANWKAITTGAFATAVITALATAIGVLVKIFN
ncbi:MAG: dUTP pyrophosphatase [Deltaproteobacteria bacterium]|nr:dUTP pyrophosphatase [Deltaproteobacteria bacterium]